MSKAEYAPYPPDHAVLEIAEISAVCYAPEGAKAVIWFTSTMGQKVALVAPLTDLNLALMQIQSDPTQTRPAQARLRVVEK
jgi:hypothetical protein